jgi:D-alanine-D-alanine ligase
MDTFRSVIDQIDGSANGRVPMVFNLCDGDEINGSPGISVLHYLNEKGLSYTGASVPFYEVTTSKVTMKKAFDRAGVPTPAWEVIQKEQEFKGIFERLGSPLIIKPAISGGSMGVSVKNVVHNEAELEAQVRLLYEGYRGWDLASGGLIVEEFIAGPEYTTLVVGSSDRPDNCIIYQPVERVFHSSLPETEKFLSFDRLWEFYEQETAMPGNANFFDYHLPDKRHIPTIQKITMDAYRAVGGKGYARLDIRMNAKTQQLFVLEANAQCGLSEDENNTSIGAILRVSGKSFAQLVTEIIEDGIKRKSLPAC